MDIKPVFNEHKAMKNKCQCLSKTENQCLQATEQAAMEVFKNNIHHHETMKTIAEAYLSLQIIYKVKRHFIVT